MRVPFFDLKRQYEEIGAQAEKRVCEVMRSGQYVEGPAVKEFERRMADYLSVKHVVTCGNGTDALRIALQAAGVGAGDEVITTAFSFFATAEAIAQAGAVPVFADIDGESFNIDVQDAERKITPKTKAILPVHIFGMPADMDELNRLADGRKLAVIEDACQAVGSSYRGKKAGNLGTAGCFSFYPTKNLGAFGDGGMITTNDDGIAESCRSLKAHAAGRPGALAYWRLSGEALPELAELAESGDSLYDPCKYYNYMIGANSRLDSMQAAVLLEKLGRLDGYNQKRKQIALAYTEQLSGLPVVTPKTDAEDRESCWHQYAILTEHKEELISYLGEQGVGAGVFYPVPLHLQKAFRGLGYREGDLPVAEDICKKSVCLPMFPELTAEEVSYVTDMIKKFFAERHGL